LDQQEEEKINFYPQVPLLTNQIIRKMDIAIIINVYQFLSPFDVIPVRFTSRSFYIASILDTNTNPTSSDLEQVEKALILQKSKETTKSNPFETIHEAIPDILLKSFKTSLLALHYDRYTELEPKLSGRIDNLYTLSWIRYCMMKFYTKNPFTLQSPPMDDIKFLTVRNDISQLHHLERERITSELHGSDTMSVPNQNCNEDQHFKYFVEYVHTALNPFRVHLRKPIYLLCKQFGNSIWRGSETFEITMQMMDDFDDFSIYFQSPKCRITHLTIHMKALTSVSFVKMLANAIKKNVTLKMATILLDNTTGSSKFKSRVDLHFPILMNAFVDQNKIESLIILGTLSTHHDYGIAFLEVTVPSTCTLLYQRTTHRSSTNTRFGAFRPMGEPKYDILLHFKNIVNLVDIRCEDMVITSHVLEVLESPDCRCQSLYLDDRMSILESLKASWMESLSKNKSLKNLEMTLGKKIEDEKLSRLNILKYRRSCSEFFSSLPSTLTTITILLECDFLIYNMIPALSQYFTLKKINFGLTLGVSFSEHQNLEPWNSLSGDTTSTIKMAGEQAKIVVDLLQGLKTCEFDAFTYSCGSALYIPFYVRLAWKDLKCDKFRLNVGTMDGMHVLAILRDIQAPDVELFDVEPDRYSENVPTLFETVCVTVIRNKNIKNIIFEPSPRLDLHYLSGLSYLLGSHVKLKGTEVTEDVILNAFAKINKYTEELETGQTPTTPYPEDLD
jgi:hypothetical protein